MKRWLFVFSLMPVVFGACQKEATIGPAVLLFKRWQVYQTRDVSSPTWTMQTPGTYYDLEYRQDGTVIYYKDSVVTATPCCAGSRFERKGVFIQYAEFPACPTVYCGASTDAQILALNDTLLELQTGDRITQYKPAP
ncbi:hypothetical protein [Spirosoma radiotolerans]|uniref:Lipoprotein n=1 Tax=Spirosoma radiotolerans TaxID=1379870 RepID=A0A0E3ZZT8_9BACT|nr:hypothetical protein [Spirosoma radiotolerans]AKD57558.1 hypothetical protein SD10_24335 [Spirosoma radiotolerans]